MDGCKDRKQGGQVGRGTNRLEMDVGEERKGQQDSTKEMG